MGIHLRQEPRSEWGLSFENAFLDKTQFKKHTWEWEPICSSSLHITREQLELLLWALKLPNAIRCDLRK